MKFSKFCLGVLVLLLTSLTASMSGQSVSTSQVSGVVQDESGAVVPGAQITLTQTETGQVHKVTSNSAGNYTIPDLPSGPYSLEVTATGFSTYVEKGIVITVGTNPSIAVKLAVGQVTQQVVVEAAAGAQVETQSNGIGQVIDQK